MSGCCVNSLTRHENILHGREVHRLADLVVVLEYLRLFEQLQIKRNHLLDALLGRQLLPRQHRHFKFRIQKLVEIDGLHDRGRILLAEDLPDFLYRHLGLHPAHQKLNERKSAPRWQTSPPDRQYSGRSSTPCAAPQNSTA
jgi:hypothetical protein